MNKEMQPKSMKMTGSEGSEIEELELDKLRFKPYAVFRNGQLNLLEFESRDNDNEIRRILKESEINTTIFIEKTNEKEGSKERKIVPFWDGAFSNFFPSKFEVNNKQFCCSEQFFHYCKAILFGDLASAEKIMETDIPGETKRIGRGVQGFDVAIWDKCSILAMVVALMRKFQQNLALKSELMATNGAELIEASPFDGIWGTKKSAIKILCGEKWKGTNYLGRALMAIRDHFLEPTFSDTNQMAEMINQKQIIPNSPIHKFANEVEILLANKLLHEFNTI